MKTNRLYGILAALLLFTFGGYAQEDVSIITLLCNTDGLTQENILQQCRFEGQEGNDTKNFLYEATTNDDVIWQAYDTSTNNRRINVTRIRYVRGTNPFNWTERNGRSKGNQRGRVNGGQPVRITPDNDLMVYAIDIQVQGLPGPPLSIDPVLKVPR